MNNLIKVYNIWSKLESSYENLRTELNVTSKAEFVKKLIGYSEKDNTTQVEYIKGKVNEDLGKYTPSELKAYTVLNNILTGIDYLCKLGKLDNITEDTDLNSLVDASIVETNTIKETSRKLPNDFFENLSPITNSRFKSESLMTLDEVYNLTGNIGETFILSDNDEVKEYLITDSKKEYFVFNDAGNILDIFASLEDETTRDFALYCVNAYRVLKETNKIKPSTIFLSKKYYTQEGKDINLKLGEESFKLKVTPTKVLSDAKLIGYYFKIKSKGHNIDIVLLDV